MSALCIRRAQPTDCAAMMALVKELAVYEKTENRTAII